MDTTTRTAPAYMKVDREIFETCEKLAPARSAKLMRALMRLFFDGIEPEPGELPHDAMLVYNAKHSAMVSWRNSVKNGSKNVPKPQHEIDEGFEAHADVLPAVSLELGTYPTPNPRGALGRGVGSDVGTPINKHESLNMNQLHSSDEDGGTGRQGNTAELPPCLASVHPTENGCKVFTDLNGNAYTTIRDAVAASFKIRGFNDVDGFLAKVATLCGSCRGENVGECYPVVIDAIGRAKFKDPWGFTQKLLKEERGIR